MYRVENNLSKIMFLLKNKKEEPAGSGSGFVQLESFFKKEMYNSCAKEEDSILILNFSAKI